jgi:hypothetical protein
MVKKVLIVALNENWTGISRLPSGLDRAGFDVYAICPKKSFLAHTKFLKKAVLYPTFTYSRSKLIYLWIVAGILYFKPDLLIPGDEDTILALQNLSNSLEKNPFFGKISILIRKSLTPKSFDSIVLSKSDFQEKCREWGLRTPRNLVLDNVEMALVSAREMGYPVVLKHDSGYGGSGVFICQTETDIKNHFDIIQKESVLKKIRVILKNTFFISIFNNDSKISLQQYIDGRVGQSPFCAESGVVFGFNPMLRLHTYPGKTGPASVSQGFENPDIEYFVKTVAKKLNYTGFGSLEYMIDEKTKQLFIIELNPRPTPTCHISSQYVTNDLCDVFYKGLNSIFLEDRKTFVPYTVAMFPGEKKRDPYSPYLTENYHDIPLNDPLLLKALEQK